MKARDELATLIAKHHDKFFGLEYAEPATQDIQLAEELISDGWAKPRTITDWAELAELHMVVVRTEAGSIANIVNGRAYFFGYEASTPIGSLSLPATVLHDLTEAS